MRPNEVMVSKRGMAEARRPGAQCRSITRSTARTSQDVERLDRFEKAAIGLPREG
jgi:hypothetical protein